LLPPLSHITPGDSTRIFISILQLSSADINTSSFELHQILDKRIRIRFFIEIVIPPEYARIE
jgi:hypothetical protein